MIAEFIDFAQNIKIKWFDVKVQCFVIEKQFGHQTQCLTVCGVIATIDFEHSNYAFAIDFVARWRSNAALFLQKYGKKVKIRNQISASGIERRKVGTLLTQ